MQRMLRRALTACVLIGSTSLVLAPANAAANTPPDCTPAATTDYQIQAVLSAGNDTSTNVDFLANCFDSDGDALSITGIAAGPKYGSAVQHAPDPDNGYATDYVVVTPATDFVGRDVMTVDVSDGTDSTTATLYLHVEDPSTTVDCGPTYTKVDKGPNDSVDQPLSCYSWADVPNNVLTYSIENVSPASETSHVSVHSFDPGDGSDPYEVITFDNQITAAKTSVQLKATDGTGSSDEVFVEADLQRDPVCTGADADNSVLIEQESNIHTTLSQPLFCSDPDGTTVTYSDPSFIPSNVDPTPPGTLTIDPATSYATFVPTDPDWAGVDFWSVDVSDGNGGTIGLQIEVSRYQQADLATTITAPASATIGTSFTAHLRMQNHGPDTVTGTYVDVELPYGSEHGTLPAGCVDQAPRYFECTFATLAPDADTTVNVPVDVTGFSFPGSAQIGAQVGSDNLHDNVPANDVTAATLTLTDPTSGSATSDVFHGSAAANTYYAGGGNDKVGGAGGNDALFLGTGNDCGEGDAGADRLHGDDGTDTLYGDAGPCVTDSAPARVLTTLTGNDVLFGDAGNDALHGGPGTDSLYGGIGTDKLYGDDGNDTLHGDAGADNLAGGDGADKLFGGSGKDVLYGGAGNDVIAARDKVGGEVISCGTGYDTVYADHTDKVAKDCEKVIR